VNIFSFRRDSFFSFVCLKAIAVLFALMQFNVLSFACTKESTKEKCSQKCRMAGLRCFWHANAHEQSLKKEENDYQFQ
jgi:hypothetical protein